MVKCEKCQRKRRVIERLEKQKGKRYWIARCIICKTPLEMEEYKYDKPKSGS